MGKFRLTGSEVLNECHHVHCAELGCVQLCYDGPFRSLLYNAHNGEDQNEPMRTKKRATSRSRSYS